MKRTVLLFIMGLALSTNIMYAQERVLKGRVVFEGTSISVVGVVVTVQAGIDGKVLSYGMTDDSGAFSLSVPQNSDSLCLTASSMMTETVTIPVSSGEDGILIQVKEKLLSLKESIIQVPKVSAHGDTLNYNVSSYVKADDRNIGEVLKRIPGVTVNSNGEIYYQNSQINKFYVEGLDLLQGRYGLASKNIDPSMVATIQILENHQPIRVLEGTEIPEQAAINLKLKKSALGAFFINLQVGLGFAPILYSNEILGMRFTQSQQNLILYKNDNTGRDISSEMTSFYGSASSQILTFFSPEVLASPSIEKQHFLFNNAHLFSLNDLRILRKNFTLTSNVHFLLDRQQKTGSFRQSIVNPVSGGIYIAEDLTSSLSKRELASTITLEKNEKDHYLTNRTDANIAWNQQDCSVESDISLSQSARLPSFCIENMFAYKTDKDRFSSHLLYSWQDNALRVSPVLIEDIKSIDETATQQIQYGQLEADLRYYRNIRLSRYLSLEVNLRPFVKNKRLVSGFQSGNNEIDIKADSLSNNITRLELGTDIGEGVRYHKGPITAFFYPSGQYLFITRNNHILTEQSGQHCFLLLPVGYIEYKRRNFTYRIDASYQQIIPDIRYDLTGYLMSSYRSFHKTDGVSPYSGRFSADLGVHYRDVGSSFFVSAIAGYRLTHKNTLTSLLYEGIICRATEMKYENRSENLLAKVELGTDIRPISSTFKINAEISRGKYVSLYQGSVANCAMDVLQLSPSWYSIIRNIASFSYEAHYHLGRSVIENNVNKPLHDLSQFAEVTVSPFKNSVIKLSCNHYFNSGLPSGSSRWFANMGLSYKFKKTEWILDWTNIFNTKEIVSFYYDDISSYCSSYALRPMEVLLRVKINIL